MSATPPILHHFALSPFSEKLRLVLGFKGLRWRSVQIPMVMPKPDVTALTGGYRRTPLLQIGADIYCDTALCARVIEAQQPAPTLYPASAPLASAAAAWADANLFWQAIGVTQEPSARAHLFAGMTPEAIQAVGADRAAFTASVRRPRPVDAAAQFGSALAMFERALATNAWLSGPEPSIADFSVYHCLWFVARAGLAERWLRPRAGIYDWMARMAAFGQGPHDELDSAAALAEAARAAGHAPVVVQAGLGFDAGESVTVAATDYGTEPVTGDLVGLTADQVTLRREDARAGIVHVHFPRYGYQIQKAGSV